MSEQVFNGMILPEEHAKIRVCDSNEYRHPSPQIIASFEFDAIHESVVAKRKVDPVGSICRSEFHAKRTSGRRPHSVIGLHVIHCTQTEAGTARGVARYFASGSAQGSAHYVMDDYNCYRCLRDDQIPWGAPGANYRGLHYEQCGFVSWAKFIWSRRHRRTINRTAWEVARDCRRYGNPVRWLDVHALQSGRKGITDHATCTKAFGGSHTDPGPNYPRGLFMSLVRFYYLRMRGKKL